ncbi:hypothetical protein NDU88_003021 [Pleurodeles waltl]|uniref:Uncharacterized protein n=1 Tax=Pleurodeles waltl TaxID=8319 RepID=A0AAV7W4V6_PLEWA|nr:hypothetical protein NDU88_003021 [Pleurodeles waltl]
MAVMTGTVEGLYTRNEYCFRGRGDPEKEPAVKEKGDNGQREKREDAGLGAREPGTRNREGRGPEAGEPGTLNGEYAGTMKEEEEVPKEADHEEEGGTTSEVGWKADRGGVQTYNYATLLEEHGYIRYSLFGIETQG